MPASASFSRSLVSFRPAALMALLLAAAPLFGADANGGAKAPVPIVSSDAAVQQELLNLDRALDMNPKLEETLRNNLDQLTEANFRANNPDIDALLKRQPGIVPALKKEQHFFIHRSVARLARSRVTRNDVMALDEFLSGHPDIARALQRKPSQIVNQDFLIAHPELGAFFEKHPALSSILLQREGKEGKKGKAPVRN